MLTLPFWFIEIFSQAIDIVRLGLKLCENLRNESMVSFVLRRYMRGENGEESLWFVCEMALRSVLVIRIGKQNVQTKYI